MKTIIVFSNFEDLPYFYLLDGDYSHLNNVCVNTTKDNQELQDELDRLLINKEYSLSFPAADYNAETKVIVTGFLP